MKTHVFFDRAETSINT